MISVIPTEKKYAVLNQVKKKKVIVIAGPTATGKTDLSLDLASLLPSEIVSADSMQVYKGLDIGSAKATKQQMDRVPHHLIDIRSVDEPYNVAAYAADALEAITHILADGKTPIVVGGNGFYLHALIYGPPLGPSSVPEIRMKIEEDLDKFGVEMLFNKLQSFDPDYAKTITLQDRHKIVRGLEIMMLTGKRVSEFPKPGSDLSQSPFDFQCYFIYYPRPVLYPRIEKRCEEMIESGLIEETERMLSCGLDKNNSAMCAIGYRQVIDYIRTNRSKEDFYQFLNEFKKASRQYAKRQFTWFKKEPLFEWVNLEELPRSTVIEKIIQAFYL